MCCFLPGLWPTWLVWVHFSQKPGGALCPGEGRSGVTQTKEELSSSYSTHIQELPRTPWQLGDPLQPWPLRGKTCASQHDCRSSPGWQHLGRQSVPSRLSWERPGSWDTERGNWGLLGVTIHSCGNWGRKRLCQVESSIERAVGKWKQGLA